jgi:hypothetical protein
MSCDGTAYATAAEFETQWYYDFGLASDADATAELNALLVKSAGRIHAAMQASGQCDCTLAAWATEYLKELNMVGAAVMFNIPAVRLSPEQRTTYNEYLRDQLELIRTGQIELCQGETAKAHPAFGVAELALTERNAARIIDNRRQREGT